MNSILKIQGALKLQGRISFAYSYPEINNWIAALTSNNLPLPSTVVLDAIDRLLVGLYQNNLRSKILRLNLFCGVDYISSFFPIIKDVGLTWDYNGAKGSTVGDLANGPFQAADWSLTTGFNAANNVNYVVSGNVTGNTNTILISNL